MKDFKELKVWQKAHEMTLSLYKISESFPKEEAFGLTSQIKRAAVSVPANIAEGCGKDSSAELARFMQISAGSTSELEYHVLLAHDLGFIDSKTHQELSSRIIEVRKMLYAFLKKLKSDC